MKELRDLPSNSDSETSDDEDGLFDARALLHEKFKESGTGNGLRLSGYQPEDRAHQMDAIKRQLRMEEEKDTRHFYRDTFAAMERDVEAAGGVTDKEGSETSGSDESDFGDEDADMERAGDDSRRRRGEGRTEVSSTSTGALLWSDASPLLYTRMSHIFFHFSSRALRLRKDLKPEVITSDLKMKEEKLEALDDVKNDASEEEKVSDLNAPLDASGLELASGWSAEELHQTNLARFEELDDEGMAHVSDDEASAACEGATSESSVRSSSCEDESEGTSSSSEEQDDALTALESECALATSGASTLRFPAIENLFEKFQRRIDEAFAAYSARCPNTVEDWETWSEERKRELRRGSDMMHAALTAGADLSLNDVSRRVFRVLEALGFPDRSCGTGAHDFAVATAADVSCYSYHPRVFSTMSSLNANLNPFGLMAVLNLEQTDRRLGKPTLVPEPHPHPEINTRVILCEPKKKRSVVDDYRSLTHPKKAGIHGVEDFLVEEELTYRHCVQLREHLGSRGTLRGLPTHLYPLVYSLVGYDVEDFSKLQSAKKGFLTAAPAPLMRRIVDALRRKLARLEGSREGVRLATGKIGFYCQAATWRDQALRALHRYGTDVHHFAGMGEVTHGQGPVLVRNPWAIPSKAEWLLKAVQLFVSEGVPVVNGFLVPILTGKWHAEARGIDHRPLWSAAWGSGCSSYALLVPLAVVQGLQALLALTELLECAHDNTIMDPLQFLSAFAEIQWQHDVAAAAFLVQRERICNVSTARLVALGACVDWLRRRVRYIEDHDGVALTKRLLYVQSQALTPSSTSAAHEQIEDDDVHTRLIRVTVSGHSAATGLDPTLALIDVGRVSSCELAAFFGSSPLD